MFFFIFCTHICLVLQCITLVGVESAVAQALRGVRLFHLLNDIFRENSRKVITRLAICRENFH